jgi:hypothetical protein
MPETGANPIRVAKFDFLTKIDPGDHFRMDLRRQAESGQRRFKVDAQARADYLAPTIVCLGERENKLLLPVDEEASVALVLLPLLDHGTGKLVHLVRFQTFARRAAPVAISRAKEARIMGRGTGVLRGSP